MAPILLKQIVYLCLGYVSITDGAAKGLHNMAEPWYSSRRAIPLGCDTEMQNQIH